MSLLQEKILGEGFVKISKAAPLLMPLFLRGAATGASSMGHRAMLEQYGRALADKGIDPMDLPGKRQDTWIDPTMMYGMGLGLSAHLANQYGLFGDSVEQKKSDAPLFLGTALGGAFGAYKTYKAQQELAKDVLSGKKTKDTEYVKTRDYIKDTLDKQKK